MKTLNRIATLLMTVFAVLGLFATPGVAQGDWTLYVGTYTKAQSKGIYAYKFQSSTGKLTPIGLAGESSNPSFLAVHPSQRFLYAANENNAGMVSAFAIDPATASLKLLNSVSSKGSGPCHVSVDKTGKWLFVANYNNGIAAAYPIHEDGSLGEATATFQHAGKSVNAQRQSGPHAHVAAISPDNRFVWVADLGLDEVRSYRIDPAKGGMTPNDPPFAKVEPGFGPRHVVFRADSKFAYVMSEMSAAVTVFAYDAAKGTMQQVQVISTLPDGYTGAKAGAEIAITPNSKFLYASNRGHDSIAIFKVDAAKGTLTAGGTVPTQGKTPRNFAIDPTGNYLLAANQDSNSIVVFKIDQQTGGLTPTGQTLEIGSPVSLVFVSTASGAAVPGRGEEIPLWANGAPGSEGIDAPEVSTPSGNAKYAGWPADFAVTHNPSVYVFLPPKGKATGAAMVVAPGGGHTHLVIEKEGWEIADWLNERGIAAFVLKYRLAKAPGSTYTLPKEVYADAARSMRLVRSRAKQWDVDPARVGFIGFSAGGEVAGMIETKFDAGRPDAADPIERVSSRPDFNILIYPFYRPGAQNANAEPLFPVPNNAPPVFMACADDDRSHVEPTVKFYLELEAKHVPAEMHIYAYGNHGFALRPTAKAAPVMSWPDRLQDWLAERGYSK
jgi:6-phosphogluconolactonase